MIVKRIETARLWLRPCSVDDLDGLHRLWTHADMRRYLWDDETISRDVALTAIRSSEESFRTDGFGLWLVHLRDLDAAAGFCGFRHFGEPPEVEILYGIAPDLWGRGLATEAAHAMLRLGFEENGFARVYAGADPPNAASFRVMEKTAMRFSKRISIDGRDVIYYVIEKQDFKPDPGSEYSLERC